MKKIPLRAMGLCLVVAVATSSHAQMSAELLNCNDIKANNFGLKNSAKMEDFAYVLEKSIAPDVWMSVQKANEEKVVANFLDLKPGTYRVKLARTDERESVLATSNTVIVKNCSGKGTIGATKMVTYPNPASEAFSITIYDTPNIETMNIEMVNLHGKVVKYLKPRGGTTTFSAADLPKGVYFLCLKANGDTIAREKLVIN